MNKLLTHVTLVAALSSLLLQPASAERKSIEVGPFELLPQSKMSLVEPGVTYINFVLMNIVNNIEKPWFASGDSTISLFMSFDPLGPMSKTKWNYAAVLNKVGEELHGVDQHIPIGPRLLPLPKLSGDYSPRFSAHLIELDRSDALGPYIQTLNKTLSSIPNPYTAAASTAVGLIFELYEKLYLLALEKSKQHIELGSAGFSFIKELPPDGSLPKAGIPMLGNVVYVLLGINNYGGQNIDLDWVRQNLALDSSATKLVYKRDITFNKGWLFGGDIAKKTGDAFDLTSYILFRFETTHTIFEPRAIYEEEGLQQHFAEARMGSSQLRAYKWEHIAVNLTKSRLFSATDVKFIQSAYEQYMTATCPGWFSFWDRCYKFDKQLVSDTYGKGPPDKLDRDTFDHTLDLVFSDELLLGNMAYELNNALYHPVAKVPEPPGTLDPS